MRQSAQRKGVLIDILALLPQFANEVSAPSVMGQVAEFRAAERIVTEILDNGASIGIGMCFFKLFF